MSAPQKVWVARYEHRHGVDVRVFASLTGATAWRKTLAQEYWSELTDDDPETDDIGAEYFDKAGDAPRPEYFEIDEVELLP